MFHLPSPPVVSQRWKEASWSIQPKFLLLKLKNVKFLLTLLQGLWIPLDKHHVNVLNKCIIKTHSWSRISAALREEVHTIKLQLIHGNLTHGIFQAREGHGPSLSVSCIWGTNLSLERLIGLAHPCFFKIMVGLLQDGPHRAALEDTMKTGCHGLTYVNLGLPSKYELLRSDEIRLTWPIQFKAMLSYQLF